MKWFRTILGRVIFHAVLGTIGFYSLPLLNNYQTSGSLDLPGLTADVTVQRDENGMAYIRARNLDDLFMAQGFVTAQDRLFQMQLNRMLAQGRISELAGEKTLDLDRRMRTIGLHRLAQKQAAILNSTTTGYFQKYVDGINAFIETTPQDLHLEFRLAGIPPEKWDIADSLSILYYMGYATAANLDTEIISQMLLQTVGYEKTIQVMPVNINPDDPADTGTIPIPSARDLLFSDTLITQVSDFFQDRHLRAGSNNWAVSPDLSETGAALVCGDPHLDPRVLPGVWYPVGLICPGIRAVGAHIPGIPGMAIGRTDHIALAMTNNYGDMQDLYIERVDPDNPGHYLEENRSIAFDTRREIFKIKDKNAPDGFVTRKFTVRSSKRGPIVTDLFSGLTTDKPISLRFAPAESMTSDIGMLDIITAKNSAELAATLRKIPMVCLNWVFADAQGNIGHQVSGSIPVREDGHGTFPRPVTGNTDNWLGWISKDLMPGTLNPDTGWVGTCNHKTVTSDYPYYYSSYFAPRYRYERLKELMGEKGKKGVQEMWQYQRDVKNKMAQALAPVIARILMNHGDTRQMGELLGAWDHMDDPDAAAPAIFQTVYTIFAKKVFTDELGETNSMLLLNAWYFWQERLQQMVLAGRSDWFDDTRTHAVTETMSDLFWAAGIEAKTFLEEKLGTDMHQWQWGQIHTLDLVNPLARKNRAKNLLGTGPMPMGGSGETIYRGWYDFDAPFDITHCASLRMVVDFSDNEKITAVLPGGVTGRTFHPNQKDQVPAFMSGEKLYWWFSDQAIDAHTVSTLVLSP
ncbi:MAG: penicillin acylase family protein [Desulfotignum sp.]|nr:penicillin acylase family protein [Desulfotignum sp.]